MVVGTWLFLFFSLFVSLPPFPPFPPLCPFPLTLRATRPIFKNNKMEVEGWRGRERRARYHVLTDAREFVCSVLTLVAASPAPSFPSCQDGSTALMIASMEGRLEVVKALLAAGADVNAQDKKVQRVWGLGGRRVRGRVCVREREG